MLYVIVDTRTRKPQRVGVKQLYAVENETLLTFPELLAEPSSREFVWDTATDAYVALPSFAPVPISRTKISKREFRNRLGQPVRLAILSIRESTSAELSLPRRMLLDMKETLDAVNEVDLADANTIAGVNELLALGLIVADDVTRLLAPSTVAAE